MTEAEGRMGEAGFKVLAATFFGKVEVARFPTLEQAEHRVQELNEWAERNPRGYVQYVIRPVEPPPEERGQG